MKRIIRVLLLAVIVFGCGQQKKDPIKAPKKAAHAANNAPLFHYGNPVLLQYDRYMAALDTQLIDMASQAVDTFQLLFKKQPAAICDTAFYIFNRYHGTLCGYLNEKMPGDSIDYMDFISLDEHGKPVPLSKKHKAKKRALNKNGFNLESEEGMVFITQDQHFILQHFGKYVSAPMKQYLTQLDKEQQEGFQEDAGLTIEPVTFADLPVCKRSSPDEEHDAVFFNGRNGQYPCRFVYYRFARPRFFIKLLPYRLDIPATKASAIGSVYCGNPLF
jgi:hypothetical protein